MKDREEGSGQRVVLFGSYAPSLINFRGPLIADVAARGHQVYAIAPRIDDGTAAALRALGAEPISLSLARTSLNPIGARRTIGELRELFTEIRPDVVIAYTIKPIVLASRVVPTCGVKRFVPMITGLGYPFLGGLRPNRLLIRLLAMALYRRALAVADTIIFQNEDDRADFLRMRLVPRGTKTRLVNGSGVDLERYARRPLPAEPSFLMISRLLRDKGVREYGLAAKRLKARHPRVRVALAGWMDESPDSISAAELEEMVAAGIDYLGPLDDIRPAIGEASVYVLPSYREGTPRSVLEAMAMGRPVITTDVPGCRETVKEGENGFLVPPRDAAGLEAAMLRFIAEPELIPAMGAESQRIAAAKFDVHQVNQAVLAAAGL